MIKQVSGSSGNFVIPIIRVNCHKVRPRNKDPSLKSKIQRPKGKDPNSKSQIPRPKEEVPLRMGATFWDFENQVNSFLAFHVCRLQTDRTKRPIQNSKNKRLH
jgi:hypothetical protein